eukprot:4106762-Amphidinium_carterae.1
MAYDLPQVDHESPHFWVFYRLFGHNRDSLGSYTKGLQRLMLRVLRLSFLSALGSKVLRVLAS